MYNCSHHKIQSLLFKTIIFWDKCIQHTCNVEIPFTEHMSVCRMYSQAHGNDDTMQVRAIVDNTVTKIVSPQGFVVPSFIVMGQGLPFDEWVAAISPDFPLALQVSNRAIAFQPIHRSPKNCLSISY